jgi:glycosyltransferase involved in cell wall biosynthesis/GT2 family glycosyltransferase
MKKKICIVTSDVMGPLKNGGVGTSVYLLAKELAAQQKDVTILFANQNTPLEHLFSFWQAYYLSIGIKLISLKNPTLRIDTGQIEAQIAFAVYLHLRAEDFGTIVFPDMHGPGHYCFYAKDAGLSFQKTRLWTMYHGPTSWHVKHNNGLPTRLEDLSVEHIEKTSVRMADHVFFATEHAKNVASANGFFEPTRPSTTRLFPFGGTTPTALKASSRRPKTICFFGRIETRKGIEDFLDALLLMREELFRTGYRVCLLGSYGHINGEYAQPYLERWMLKNHFPLEIINGKNRDEAIDFIKQRNCLVVLPSHEETMGFTLVECILEKIPFICSRIAAFDEVLAQLAGKRKCDFATNSPAELARALKRASGVRPVVVNKGKAKKILTEWTKDFDSIPLVQKKLVGLPKPKLSVCITHRNRHAFLSDLLRSVQTQSEAPFEVLVYDDASSDKTSQAHLKSLAKLYPTLPLRVIFGKTRRGPSQARNRLAKEAQGDYLVFCDDDNQMVPQQLKTLRTVIHASAPDILVYPFMAFAENKPLHYWIPVGETLGMNIFSNLIGDANFCMRRDAFLKTAGFDEKLFGREDQEFLLRATAQGASYMICPVPLTLYRFHPANSSKAIDQEKARLSFNGKLAEYAFAPGLLHLLEVLTAWNYARNGGQPLPVTTHVVNPQRADIAKLPPPTKDLHKFIGSFLTNEAIKVERFSLVTFNKYKRDTPYPSRGKLLPVELFVQVPTALVLYVNSKKQAIQLHPGVNSLRLKVAAGAPLTLSTDAHGKSGLVTHFKVLTPHAQ